jgi:hypothetical protein
MRKWLWFVAVALACTAADNPSLPPPPPGWVAPKPKIIIAPPQIYHVNPGPTNPVVCAVDADNNILLTVPRNAPVIFIPNKAQAHFALLQASPDLSPGSWAALGYFTNFEDGFYLVDNLGTNRVKCFYRLVPQ